jgi:hypothetical protein
MAGATFSEDRRYRYLLWRRWQSAGPTVAFVMLNPSTADERVLDPTIRRCVGFAKEWAFGAVEVVNIFAYRSTSPRGLLAVPDPVGSENDTAILGACARASLVVAAWGAIDIGGSLTQRRSEVVSKMLQSAGVAAWCLGRSKANHPRHPLMVPYGVTRERFC